MVSVEHRFDVARIAQDGLKHWKGKTVRTARFVTAVVALLTGHVFAQCAIESSAQLREAVTLDAIRAHQAVFQDIADDHGGTRAAGTSGYAASTDYVVALLDEAGYDVTRQMFDFPFFAELSPAVLQQVSPVPTVYPNNDANGFFAMLFSGSGDVTASAVAALNLGCDPSDFFGADFVGKIAVIERGVCYFSAKTANAVAAGAVGVIIYNDEARQEAFQGTLGEPGFTVPSVGASRAVGLELIAAETTVRLRVDAVSEFRETLNVLAERPVGRSDRVVVAGGHLDSVTAGPGINDNGSGVAALLEIALQMSALELIPENRVRFAFWGAEELGLIGSQVYVNDLSIDELNSINANVNFDMLGSPNFVRFVYDGDGSDTPFAGPLGSAAIENLFLSYFGHQNLPAAPSALAGRSDYAYFEYAGIPVGGLFTGAEGTKTVEEAAIFGGNAGEAYDPCYHLACDTFDNILPGGLTVLDQLSDAAAHAILCLAQDEVRLDAGDCNHDIVLDLLDHKAMTESFDGPDHWASPGCNCFDVDESGTVDLRDFLFIQRGFSG